MGQTVLPGQTHALWFVLAEAQLCPQGSGRGRASESPVISGTVHTHSPKDTGSDMHTLIPRPEGGDGPWAASPGCGVLGWHRPPSVGAPGSGCAGACVTVGRRSGSVRGRCVCRTSAWMAGVRPCLCMMCAHSMRHLRVTTFLPLGRTAQRKVAGPRGEGHEAPTFSRSQGHVGGPWGVQNWD